MQVFLNMLNKATQEKYNSFYKAIDICCNVDEKKELSILFLQQETRDFVSSKFPLINLEEDELTFFNKDEKFKYVAYGRRFSTKMKIKNSFIEKLLMYYPEVII